MTSAQSASHEQAGKLSPAEVHHLTTRLPVTTPQTRQRIKLADVDAALRLAMAKMPLNDLLFMVALEVERRSRVPQDECPFDPALWASWSIAAEGIADNIKLVARRAEKRGIV